MKKPMYPNYEQSILNTVATLFDYYNVTTPYKPLPMLQQTLQKNYEHVILLICDGLGTQALKQNLDDNAFLRTHVVETLTSVCPSTTTAAMTSYQSGLSPNEHGWLGWSLYFKEFGRTIDTFLNTDSYSGEKIGTLNAAQHLMNYEHMLDKIAHATQHKVKTYMVQANYLSYNGKSEKIGIASFDELCASLKNIANKNENSFTFAYWNEPDKTMHNVGCSATETKVIIETLNAKIKYLSEQLENTLLLISADHGMLNMKKTIALNEIKELDECLSMPPFIETRFLSLFIKPGYHQRFKQRFESYFNTSFILLTNEEARQLQIFGYGVMHPKTSDFIGDFIAIAISDIMIDYVTLNKAKKLELTGMHAGLTEEEMLVPLIMIEH